MSRTVTAAARTLPDQTLVIDNGGYTIKVGYTRSDPASEDCRSIPNCIARSRDRRIWVASQLEQCKDFGEMTFRRPVEKGYLVNWEVERAVWEHSFFSDNAILKCDPRDTNIVLTEAPNCPYALQINCDQMIFEEFEFASCYRCLAPSLNAYNDIPTLFQDPPSNASLGELPVECLMLVDSGYSHTTVTPLLHGRPIREAIRRLDIGGKVLTNYLKELLSLRHYTLMDETVLVNEIKEAVCYVSDDFRRDLERTWKGGLRDRRRVDTTIAVDYVLPDYDIRYCGEVRPHDPSASRTTKSKKTNTASGPREDILPLLNERFVVPELLFNPGDIGLKQVGLPEMIMESIATLPSCLWPAMLANVVLVGGSVKFPGLLERLRAGLRCIVPAQYHVRVARAPNPVTSTWLGGARMANNRDKLKDIVVTRQEYQEYGASWTARHFAEAGF